MDGHDRQVVSDLLRTRLVSWILLVAFGIEAFLRNPPGPGTGFARWRGLPSSQGGSRRTC
jgi:hypothetical protein